MEGFPLKLWRLFRFFYPTTNPQILVKTFQGIARKSEKKKQINKRHAKGGQRNSAILFKMAMMKLERQNETSESQFFPPGKVFLAIRTNQHSPKIISASGFLCPWRGEDLQYLPHPRHPRHPTNPPWLSSLFLLGALEHSAIAALPKLPRGSGRINSLKTPWGWDKRDLQPLMTGILEFHGGLF